MSRFVIEEDGVQEKMTPNPSGRFVIEDDIPKQSKVNPSTQASPITTTDKIIKGLRDPLDGGAQLLVNLLPDNVVKAGNKINNWVADNTGLVGRLPEGGVDQQVRESESLYNQKRAAAGEKGMDWYRIAGNLLNPVYWTVGGGTPQTASTLGKIALGAGAGAATSALSPVGEGDFANEKLKQIALGGATGGGFSGGINGLSRLVSPKSSTNPNLKLLKNEGITPTIGQTLGGRFNAVEEKMQSIPILGDAIANARGKSLTEFNNAAINRATKNTGENIQGVGQSAVKQAGDQLSAAYNNLLPKISFRPDQQFVDELKNVYQMAATGLAPQEAKKFASILQSHLSKLSPNGSMQGETYKILESQLSKDSKRFSGSSDAYQQELGSALSEVLNIFKSGLERSNPQYTNKLRDLNEGWANLVRIEGAAKSAKNAEGVFTPAQLNSAIQSADSSVRKRAVSRGDALMQDLGNAGQAVLGNKVPNSFTADRALYASTALGSYFIDPTIPAALLGGAGLYTRTGQNLLNFLASARPQYAKPIANALDQAAPRLLPFSVQVGSNFTKDESPKNR